MAAFERTNRRRSPFLILLTISLTETLPTHLGRLVLLSQKVTACGPYESAIW